MEDKMKIAVTGAFSYSGKYITRRLLPLGHEVINLTGHPNRPDPFNNQVKTYPLDFDEGELTRSLKGIDTLYNTYWIRFDKGKNTQTGAVENTRILMRAAKKAGVSRVVHISITNPSLDSSLPYFHGKALNEQTVIASGMRYAILRPTVLFGTEDILINNVAWLLRRFPFFAQIGDGQYRLQPVFIDDLAQLAVEAGEQSDNLIWDTVGPDIFTFDELVNLIAKSIRRPARIIHVSPLLALGASKILSNFVGDVMLTRDEVDGLMAGLLVSNDPPRGKTRLSDWLIQNQTKVGSKYASEIKRHYKK
jgi:nucleoside-diphosphate-sugar epimerase